MSWSPCPDPTLGDHETVDAIETLIIPRAVDLGGLEVRRALPSTKRQMVGPFIFFDQMGPAEFLTDQGIDVRPHPHINLNRPLFAGDPEVRMLGYGKEQMWKQIFTGGARACRADGVRTSRRHERRKRI